MANLPPVSEMIMTAIQMLNENTGSEKSTIQTHIESNYSSLPVDFPDSLSTHLEELTQAGQLALVNDRYKKPDSDVAMPIRRGRGRPPKQRDPLAPTPTPVKAVSVGGSGRKRGRPPKGEKVKSVPVAVTPVPVEVTGERRGRGRRPVVGANDIEVANGGN